jgi:prepilin-type N-terminal cleavage/methylation domain-containing protein
MPGTLARRDLRAHQRAFTLLEMLVSIVALTLFILIVTRLVNSMSTITTIGSKHMDADSQARSVLDRMAVDFGRIVKRADVDYYLKTPAVSQAGNDQIAFYSQVPGYYPFSGSQSPVSLVAYRVNSYKSSPSYTKLERMGKGLLWNGVTPPSSPAPTAVPMVFLPSIISAIPAWSGAIKPSPDPNYSDPDYELIGPQVFRFEYYYLLTDGTFSITPWVTGHTAVAGMRDVAAIVVAMAIIDPKSRVLLSDSTNPPQVAQVAGTLIDFSTGSSPGPGWLVSQWQTVLNNSATNTTLKTMPRTALSGIRLYERYFYLNGQTQ